MKKVDINFYPGWTRKAITFSIDDGIIPMDLKFMEIYYAPDGEIFDMRMH